MNETKLSIISKDGNIGSDVIQLTDTIRTVFTTKCIDSFKRYIYNGRVIEGDNLSLYIGEGSVEAYFSNLPLDRDTKAVSKYNIKYHPIIDYLIKNNNRKLDLTGFENLLEETRNYLNGTDSIALLDILTNLQISKTKTVSRQKDQRGNFNFQFVSEAGKNDIEFPKKIGFKVPLFAIGRIVWIELEFRFIFGYSDVDEKPVLSFTLSNVSLKEEIETFVLNFLVDEFKECSVFIGDYSIHVSTDEWKYHKNPLRIEHR